MAGSLVIAALLLSVAAFCLGRADARAFATGAARARPVFYGGVVALAVALPGLGTVAAWTLLQPPVIDRLLLEGLPAELAEDATAGGRDLALAQIHAVADGRRVPTADPAILDAAARLLRWREIGRLALFATAAAAMLAGFLIARARLSPQMQARGVVETVLTTGLRLAASVTAVATVALVASLLGETIDFFRAVSPHTFLFGTTWDPQVALRTEQVAGPSSFGALPVFAGTLFVAAVAMALAVPLGVLVAIHLAEYAPPGTRAWAKPALEVLAGVPTVVYGFVALLAVGPAVRWVGMALGLDASPNSALSVGLVTGVMILPLVSSLADDALRGVTPDLRDASLALGSTRAEMIGHVLLPAAMPGIVGGVLLALSRALGETMIALMAGGLVASISLDPLGTTTTVPVQIVTLLSGEAPLDDQRALAAYALGSTLFVVTFGLNILALRLMRRVRGSRP